jgi:hypothetical protein
LDKQDDFKSLSLLVVPHPTPPAAGFVLYQAARGEDLGFDEGEVLSLAAGLKEFADQLEQTKALNAHLGPDASTECAGCGKPL